MNSMFTEHVPVALRVGAPELAVLLVGEVKRQHGVLLLRLWRGRNSTMPKAPPVKRHDGPRPKTNHFRELGQKEGGLRQCRPNGGGDISKVEVN